MIPHTYIILLAVDPTIQLNLNLPTAAGCQLPHIARIGECLFLYILIIYRVVAIVRYIGVYFY